MQTALLGGDVHIPEPRRSPEATNDLSVIESTLRRAVDSGYMLGPGDRVARKLTDSSISLVSATEARAVRQLIQSRHLQVGGHHAVQLRGVTVSARSVLVPRKTREMVSRWHTYKPLH